MTSDGPLKKRSLLCPLCFLLSALCSALFAPPSVLAVSFDDAGTASWNDCNAWGTCPGAVESVDYPGLGDSATINSHTVTLSTHQSAGSLTLATNGTLVSNGGSRLTLSGSWLNTGGTFTAGTGTVLLAGKGASTITSNSQSFYHLTINDGLIGYWKLDEGTGTSAADSSGYGNNGTLTNMEAADWGGVTKAPVHFGNLYALDFDGSNEYVSVADAAIHDATDTADMSIAGWFNRDAFTADNTIVAKRNGQASTDVGWGVYVDDSADDIRFEISDGTDEYQLDSTSAFTATGWNHFVVTWDQDNPAGSEIYVNGVADSATDTGTIGNIGDSSNAVVLALAAESDAGTPFDGKIDDLRLYSRTLSPSESASLAAGNQPATSWETSGLLGYWPMDEGEGFVAVDASGNGYNGTLTNMETGDWDGSTKAPLDWTNGYSLDFDGSNEYIATSDIAIDGLANLTLSAWIRADTFGDYEGILSKYTSTTSDVDFLLGGTGAGSNTGLFARVANTGNTYGYTAGSLLTASTWQHVAMVYNGAGSANADKVKVYIDGTERSLTFQGTIPTTTPTNAAVMNIGYYAGGPTYFDGHIDDARIYTRALSPQEITALAVGSRPGTFLLSSALDVNGSLTIQSGTLDTGSGGSFGVSVAKAWDNNGGIFLPWSGTVTLDGTSGSHELQSGGQAFTNLTVSGNGGTWTMQDTLDIDGAYSQTNGTVDASLRGVASGSYALRAWDFDQTAGTFTARDGTVVLDGASSVTINAASTLKNFQVEDPTETGLIGYWKFDEGQGVVAVDSSVSGKNGILENGPVPRLHWSRNLVAYWKLDEGGGTSAFDGSGNGNTATLANMEAGDWSTSVLPPVDFTNRASLNFGGTDEHLDVSNQTPFAMTGPISIAMWFKTGTSQVGGMASKYDNVNPDNGYLLFMDNGGGFVAGGQIRIDIMNGNSQDRAVTNKLYNDNAWHHLATIFYADGSTRVKLYIDGVEPSVTRSGSAQSAIGSTAGYNFKVGGYSPISSGYDFTGYMDDVRIYNRPLSANEVQEIAWGRVLVDVAPTGFANDASLDFDGTNDFVAFGDLTTYDVGDSADLSISAWFRRDTFTTDDTIVGKRAGQTAAEAGWLLYIDDTDDLRFEISDGTDEYQLDSTSTFLSTGWNHVAVVWDQDSAANSEIYVNGVADAATDTGTIGNIGDSSNAVTMTIGAESDAGSPFDGMIDDVRVYDRTLSARKIYELATGRPTEGSPDTVGLAGHWTFDEGSGTAAADTSGNGNNGTLTNMEAGDWDSTVKPVLYTANPYSLLFDGSSEYVTAADSASLDLSSRMTLSAWFRGTINTSTHPNPIISKWEESGSQSSYMLMVTVGRKLDARLSTTGSASDDYAGTSTIADGTWYHGAATYDGSNVRIYVNGVLESTTARTGSLFNSTSSVQFGRAGSSPVKFWNGYIDDPRIYSRALSNTEILNLSLSGLAAADAGTATFTLGAALDANGDIDLLGGILDASASNYGISVAGDWLAGLGDFVARSGVVTFDGAAGVTQNVLGVTAFNNFTKTVTGTGTIAYDATGLQTYSGALTLRGVAGGLLLIRSTSSGSAARMYLDGDGGTQLIDYSDVKDSNASGGQSLGCGTATEGCRNGGNDTNWNFSAAVGNTDYFYFFGE